MYILAHKKLPLSSEFFETLEFSVPFSSNSSYNQTIQNGSNSMLIGPNIKTWYYDSSYSQVSGDIIMGTHGGYNCMSDGTMEISYNIQDTSEMTKLFQPKRMMMKWDWFSYSSWAFNAVINLWTNDGSHRANFNIPNDQSGIFYDSDKIADLLTNQWFSCKADFIRNKKTESYFNLLFYINDDLVYTKNNLFFQVNGDNLTNAYYFKIECNKSAAFKDVVFDLKW